MDQALSNANQTFRGKPSPDLQGEPYLAEVQSLTNPGNSVTLVNYTVPAGDSVRLLHFAGSCALEGRFEIKIDSQIIGSCRTQPGAPNCDFYWSPLREVLPSEVITVEFIAMAGRPSTFVEAYLQGRIIEP